MDFGNVPVREILLVVYGGLFGWTLSMVPRQWVYVVLAMAILTTIVFVMK